MQVDAKTLEKCPALSEAKSGADKVIVAWGIGVVLDYADCADRQEKLAKAYEDTRKIENETPKRAWFSWLGF